jgi:hypothetical protein
MGKRKERQLENEKTAEVIRKLKELQAKYPIKTSRQEIVKSIKEDRDNH